LDPVSPAPSSEIGIAPERLAGWLAEDDELQVVDVREPYEREAGHIAGTRHIELTKLSEQAASLDSSRPVVFYCRVGARSMMAASAFRAAGYDAYTLGGGLLAWVDAGLPITPDGGYVAEH
jgi:hydroxyacylglutathione hydrolase/adenylyltransferase/sulfurtransferase